MLWRQLLVLHSALLLVACTSPELSVADARVRALVPGTDKTVGYFSLTNHTDQTLTLIGARAEGVRTIELHTTMADEQGFTRMRRLSEVSAIQDEALLFTQGGHHLMLFGVERLGEELKVSLLFAERDPLEVTFRTAGLLE